MVYDGNTARLNHYVLENHFRTGYRWSSLHQSNVHHRCPFGSDTRLAYGGQTLASKPNGLTCNYMYVGF